MRVVIEDVIVSEDKSCWLVDKREFPEEGDPPELQVNADVIVRHKIPFHTVAYRCAEYGITDLNVITDMIICEPYVEAGWWAGDDHLFAAGNIEEARRLFITKIAEIKLKYRISTRGANHPLMNLKRTARIEATDVALKSMGVLLTRHRNGAQELDPHVARSLVWMEKGLNAAARGEVTFVEEGGKRA